MEINIGDEVTMPRTGEKGRVVGKGVTYRTHHAIISSVWSEEKNATIFNTIPDFSYPVNEFLVRFSDLTVRLTEEDLTI